MFINVKKLERIVTEMVDHVGGPCLNATTCVGEYVNKYGHACQVHVVITCDEDELIECDLIDDSLTCFLDL